MKYRSLSLTGFKAEYKDGNYFVETPQGVPFVLTPRVFASIFWPDNGSPYGITQKQQAVLDYIISREESPSIREIMDALGYKSPSVVKRHLDNLKSRGHIDFLVGKARSIRVL